MVLTKYGVHRSDMGNPTGIQKNNTYNLDINTLTAATGIGKTSRNINQVPAVELSKPKTQTQPAADPFLSECLDAKNSRVVIKARTSTN